MAKPVTRPEPARVDWVRRIAELTGRPEEEVRRRVAEVGLDEVRLETAILLYTSRSLSTGEVAEMVGMNRGAVIRAFIDRRVAPYDDPEEDEQEIWRQADENVKKILKLWKGPGLDPGE
jgi:predicted HTH domain antitoxin